MASSFFIAYQYEQKTLNVYIKPFFESKNLWGKNDWTPLHKAARNGHLKIYEILMDNLEDKNPRDNYGNTPLHIAAITGHFKICELRLR